MKMISHYRAFSSSHLFQLFLESGIKSQGCLDMIKNADITNSSAACAGSFIKLIDPEKDNNSYG